MSGADLVTHESIGALIRSTAESMPGEFDAATLADMVIERIAPELYVTYLRSLISARVSAEVGGGRRGVTPARKVMSTKQSLIRDEYWPRFLNQHIALPSGYKRLAEATVDDLMFLAEQRRAQANELMMRADQFEALATLMRKQRVKILEQIDSTAGEKLLAA